MDTVVMRVVSVCIVVIGIISTTSWAIPTSATQITNNKATVTSVTGGGTASHNTNSSTGTNTLLTSSTTSTEPSSATIPELPEDERSAEGQSSSTNDSSKNATIPKNGTLIPYTGVDAVAGVTIALVCIVGILLAAGSARLETGHSKVTKERSKSKRLAAMRQTTNDPVVITFNKHVHL